MKSREQSRTLCRQNSMENFFQICLNCGIMIYRAQVSPYMLRQFENYVGLAAGYMAESCEQRGCCGVQYAVEADGSVYPCDFYVMDEYQIGNFNTDSFDQIDQKRSEIRFIEQSSLAEKACRSCPYFYYAEVDVGETGEMGYRQNQQGTIFVKDIKSSLKNGMIR